MQTANTEIPLGEVLRTIRAHIISVLTFVFLGFATTVYYLQFVAVPEFEATSRFELLDTGAAPSISSAAGVLGSLSGFLPAEASEADTMRDRILSRPFVDKLYEEAGFPEDPLFNKRLVEKGVKSKLLALIFGEAEEKETTRDDDLAMAIAVMEKRMRLTVRENGIIVIGVTHTDPERAAFLANLLVEKALAEIFDRSQERKDESLRYFANELSEIQADLDAANAAVRDFALKSSIQSSTDLAATSVRLSQLRSQLEFANRVLLALYDLKNMSVDGFSGDQFASRHPVAGELAVRRLLDFALPPSSWKLPSEAAMEAALQNYENQKTVIQSSLSLLEAQAEFFGEDSLELATLERDVQVQKAIYQAAITQFETQSLVSNFEEASGRVIEMALPPVFAVKPDKKLILAVFMMLSFFAGVVFVLIRSRASDLIYSSGMFQNILGGSDAIELTGLFKEKLARDAQVNMPKLMNFLAANSTQFSRSLVVVLLEERKAQVFSGFVAECMNKVDRHVVRIDLGRLFENPKGTSQPSMSNTNTEQAGTISITAWSDLKRGDWRTSVSQTDEESSIVVYGVDAFNSSALLEMLSFVDEIIVVVERGHTTRGHLSRLAGITSNFSTEARRLIAV